MSLFTVLFVFLPACPALSGAVFFIGSVFIQIFVDGIFQHFHGAVNVLGRHLRAGNVEVPAAVQFFENQLYIDMSGGPRGYVNLIFNQHKGERRLDMLHAEKFIGGLCGGDTIRGIPFFGAYGYFHGKNERWNGILPLSRLLPYRI